METVRRIPNGPQILCIMCGDMCNHISLYCATCRVAANRRDDEARETQADRDYLEWKRAKDAKVSAA